MSVISPLLFQQEDDHAVACVEKDLQVLDLFLQQTEDGDDMHEEDDQYMTDLRRVDTETIEDVMEMMSECLAQKKEAQLKAEQQRKHAAIAMAAASINYPCSSPCECDRAGGSNSNLTLGVGTNSSPSGSGSKRKGNSRITSCDEVYLSEAPASTATTVTVPPARIVAPLAAPPPAATTTSQPKAAYASSSIRRASPSTRSLSLPCSQHNSPSAELKQNGHTCVTEKGSRDRASSAEKSKALMRSRTSAGVYEIPPAAPAKKESSAGSRGHTPASSCSSTSFKCDFDPARLHCIKLHEDSIKKRQDSIRDLLAKEGEPTCLDANTW